MPWSDASCQKDYRSKIKMEKEERKRRGAERGAKSKAKRQRTVSVAVETTPVGLMEVSLPLSLYFEVTK